MGIRLSDEEAWKFVAQAHTGIFTTLRADGWPVPLPVWFVAFDGAVHMRTPAKAKKLIRVRNDPRSSFCVETGEKWVELKSVVWTGNATLVDDADVMERVEEELGAKYKGFAVPMARVPDATKQHYSDRSGFIRFVPDGRSLTWDNSRLRLS